MSVASKTKTKMYTTVVLGLVAALSALPTWASTTPGILPLTTVSPVVSTQSNQDLSVLRARLKDRFSWVAQEVRSLIDGTTSATDALHGSATVRTLDVSQWIWVEPIISHQHSFIDIDDDPYKSYITRLSAYGVLNSTQKFYPQNYFRVDDFISLVAKLYKKTTGQTLTSQDILSLSTPDGVMTKRQLQQTITALQLDADIQIDGNLYDKLIRSEWAYYLVRLFDLPAIAVEETVSLPVWNFFTDITDTPFAHAINTLASLNIVSTKTDKFYPDNYLRHYDFTVIFVNSLLNSTSQSLPSSSLLLFADVQSNASYLPQLQYAANRWLIDYIIMSKWGQLYFDPDDFMTKHEVYQVLSKATGVQFVYDKTIADQEKVSRAELAKLLVDTFWFQPKIIESASDSTDLSGENVTLLNKLKVLLSMM